MQKRQLIDKVFFPEGKKATEKREIISICESIVVGYRDDNKNVKSWRSDIVRTFEYHERTFIEDGKTNKDGPKGTALDYYFLYNRIKGDNLIDKNKNLLKSLDTAVDSISRILDIIKSEPQAMSNILTEKELGYRDAQIISMVDNLIFIVLFTYEAIYYSMIPKDDANISQEHLKIITNHSYGYIGLINQMNKSNMDDKINKLFDLSNPLLGKSREMLENHLTVTDRLFDGLSSHFDYNPIYAIGKLFIRIEMWYLERQMHLGALYSAKLAKLEAERNKALTDADKDRLDKVIKNYTERLRKTDLYIIRATREVDNA